MLNLLIWWLQELINPLESNADFIPCKRWLTKKSDFSRWHCWNAVWKSWQFCCRLGFFYVFCVLFPVSVRTLKDLFYIFLNMFLFSGGRFIDMAYLIVKYEYSIQSSFNNTQLHIWNSIYIQNKVNNTITKFPRNQFQVQENW